MINKIKTIENKVRHILNKNNIKKPNFIQIDFVPGETNVEIDFDGSEFEIDIDPVFNVYIDVELLKCPSSKFFSDMQRLDEKWFKKYGEHIWMMF